VWNARAGEFDTPCTLCEPRATRISAPLEAGRKDEIREIGEIRGWILDQLKQQGAIREIGEIRGWIPGS
jgi:hypothetical protein